MTIRCIRCRRKLSRETASGMGEKCEVYALGSKPRRLKREDRRSADDRQRELELEALV